MNCNKFGLDVQKTSIQKLQSTASQKAITNPKSVKFQLGNTPNKLPLSET